MFKRCYKIGDINILLESIYDLSFNEGENVSVFLSDDHFKENIFNIKLISDYNHIEYNYKKIYEDKNWLNVFKDGNVYLFDFIQDEFTFVKKIFLDFNKNIFIIEVDKDKIFKTSIHIIESTYFQIIYILFLERNNGFLLHSSCSNFNSKGLIFCGKSGAGKTTLSNLILNNSGYKVLTDETTILRIFHNQVKIYGSPWKGSKSNIYRNEGCILTNIFFIRHGRENKIENISLFDALKLLQEQSFPSFWDINSLKNKTNLILKLLKIIKFNHLYIVPTKEIIKFIENNT